MGGLPRREQRSSEWKQRWEGSVAALPNAKFSRFERARGRGSVLGGWF